MATESSNLSEAPNPELIRTVGDPLLSTDLSLKARKRGRQAEACIQCRRKKIKCGRELPRCERCLRSRGRVECVYEDEPPTKRLHNLSSTVLPALPNSSATIRKASGLESPRHSREQLELLPSTGSVPPAEHNVQAPKHTPRLRGRETTTRSEGSGLSVSYLSQVSAAC